ncbi:MAG: hypothetical protein M3371_02290 [Acidobacteriota bacterium]|nr:hypothetical protein [Acidobacteriota bacterium]
MKTLRQFCAAAVLTCVLTLSAYPGEMSTGKTPPPPPPSATSAGEMSTGISMTETANSEAVDPIAEAALMLLQSILSLF